MLKPFLLAILVITQLFISPTLTQNNNDDVIKEVFGESPDEVTVRPTTAPTVITNEDGDSCKCVPYYLCDADNNNIIQDGTLSGFGQIDIRFKEECRESVEVCCKEPREEDNPVTPVPRPVIPTGCGNRNSLGFEFQISNGAVGDSEFGEFPWTIAILNAADSSPACGGALIHPQVVLTAAHCVVSVRPLELKVRAGEWDTQTVKERLKHEERPIERFIIHPKFNSGNLQYDVALVILKSSIPLADHIQPICLPAQDTNLENIKDNIASGWGKTRFGKAGVYSVIMKKVFLDTVSSSLCQQQFRNTRLGPRFKLHSTFICAGGKKGIDTCKGDGGGPLVSPIPGQKDRYQQAGIVSWGVGCGDDNVPGAYANVAKFRTWIDAEMTKAGFETSYYIAPKN